MVDTDQLFTSSAQQSTWINADNVKIGDKFVFTDEGTVDNTSFKKRDGTPNIRINFKVRNLATKEEYNLGLSKTRIRSIRDTFDEKLCEKWKDIGYIEVVGIQNYPSLNSRGILWRGVRTEAPQDTFTPTVLFKELTSTTEEALKNSKHLIEMGIPLSIEEFKLFPLTVQRELVDNLLVSNSEKGEIFFNKDACQKYLK